MNVLMAYSFVSSWYKGKSYIRIGHICGELDGTVSAVKYEEPFCTTVGYIRGGRHVLDNRSGISGH